MKKSVVKRKKRKYIRKNTNQLIKKAITKFVKKKRHELEIMWEIEKLAKKYDKKFNKIIEETKDILVKNTDISLLFDLYKFKSQRKKSENPITKMEFKTVNDILVGDSIQSFIAEFDIDYDELKLPLRNTIKIDSIGGYLFRIKAGNDDNYGYVYLLTNEGKSIKNRINFRNVWREHEKSEGKGE